MPVIAIIAMVAFVAAVAVVVVVMVMVVVALAIVVAHGRRSMFAVIVVVAATLPALAAMQPSLGGGVGASAGRAATGQAIGSPGARPSGSGGLAIASIWPP